MELLNMTIGEVSGWAALILFALLSLVEIAPIKINPWSKLLRWVGRALNAEVLSKVDTLEKELKDVKSKQKTMQEVEDERNAKAARARVLRFGDELTNGIEHSKEHFDDILDDMSEYEHYCSSHENFKNDKMGITSQYIKDVYKECLREQKFSR